ncbi:MAG TPA: family 16 glycoside hydrolase [Bacteroidales bacterium]|nr:family 16 glycoside hydrolase [Bacteroidales bacterium]
MDSKNLLKAVLFLFLLSSCINRSSENTKWQPLFNGEDLTSWDTYLGPKYDTILNKRDTIPTGFNIDPLKVFSVVELGGEKVLRISGEQYGGISTTDEFENYHLQLQFKWTTLHKIRGC